MVSVIERWNIHPDLKWLRGVRPEPEVEFNEALNAWFVYSYQDVFNIISDPKTFSNVTAYLAAVSADDKYDKYDQGDMTQLDPPEQTKYRRLVSRAFTPKVSATLEPRIHAITDELLDAMLEQDQPDLVRDLAYPLPVIVIAELLGIPASDRDMFMGHSTTYIEQLNGLSFLDEYAEADVENAIDQFMPMMDYLRDQLGERRRRQEPGEDLISILAFAEHDGARLSDQEIVNLSSLLLIMGHITTTMMIGNTVVCLDSNPDQFAMVREDRSLVAGALDESMRTISPTSVLSRRTTTAVEIAGVRIPEEQMVLPWLAAANRDPRKFDNPETFDVTRNPNPHLALGYGVHYCIGASLAKQQARIALNRLMDRFPKLYIDPNDPPVFFPNADLVGTKSLPIRTG